MKLMKQNAGLSLIHLGLVLQIFFGQLLLL